MASSMALVAAANHAAVKAAEQYFRLNRLRAKDDADAVGLASLIHGRLLAEAPAICAKGDLLARAGLPDAASDLTLGWATFVGVEEASKAPARGLAEEVSAAEWAKLHPAAKGCDEMAAEMARALGVPPGSVKVLKTEGGSVSEAVSKMVDELMAAPPPVAARVPANMEAVLAAGANGDPVKAQASREHGSL